MSDLRRNVKDSVFTALFESKSRVHQLYLDIHPEDKDVREEDIEVVTLQAVLMTGLYNDLGFLVRDKLIMLVEAQSSYPANIAVRLLMYLGKTYGEYIEQHHINVYSPTAATLPRPEFYTIYTGGKEVPDVLTLSSHFDGESDAAELKVRVLRGNGAGGVLDQYIAFCKIHDEQVTLYGRTEEAAKEIMRACLEQNVLVPFIQEHEKEVSSIMTRLFSEEKLQEIHDINLRKEAMQVGHQEGRKEGLEEGLERGHEMGRKEGHKEGHKEGLEEGVQAMVRTLRRLKLGPATVVESLIQDFGLTKDEAEAKVQSYWRI